MDPLAAALSQLLGAAALPVPGLAERRTLLERVGASAWLRFGLGVDATGPLPEDESGLASAAADFVASYDTWCAYRDCVIELRPPGVEAVRFRISPPAGPSPPAPVSPPFPASTLAVLTAWNPGGGPRPNDRANRRANERLAAHLDARLVERWPAVNAPGSRWREESFAVLGLDLDEAWRLGEAFSQLAIFYVDRGRPLLVARRRGRVVSWEGALLLL